MRLVGVGCGRFGKAGRARGHKVGRTGQVRWYGSRSRVQGRLVFGVDGRVGKVKLGLGQAHFLYCMCLCCNQSSGLVDPQEGRL